MLSGYPHYLADWRTGGLRPMTERDVIETARLVDVLYEKGVRGGAPGVPQMFL